MRKARGQLDVGAVYGNAEGGARAVVDWLVWQHGLHVRVGRGFKTTGGRVDNGSKEEAEEGLESGLGGGVEAAAAVSWDDWIGLHWTFTHSPIHAKERALR